MNIPTDVPSLVRGARHGMSQRAFAKAIGATQSMISRYERGLSSPPIDVVNSCMHIVHQSDGEVDHISVEELVLKVSTRLNGPNFRPLRLVIAQLIDGVTTGVAIKPQVTERGKK